jgi:hypothetical protein
MVSFAQALLYAVILEVGIFTWLSTDKSLKEKLERKGISVSPLMLMIDVGKVPRLKKITSSSITKRFFFGAGLINFIALLALFYWQVLPSLYHIFYTLIYGVGEATSPFVPVIPGVTIGLDAFPYIIITLAIGVAAHEFFHALAAYSVGWRVDAWGVGLLLIFPLAYVKPNEDDYKRADIKAKATVLTAGVLANTVLFLIAIPLLPAIASQISTAPTIVGLMNSSPQLPAVRAGIHAPSVILSVNETKIKTINEFIHLLQPYKNFTILVRLKLAPAKIINGMVLYDPSKAVTYTLVKPSGSMIGIYLQDLPVYGTNPTAIEGVRFTYWLEIINISLGLINAAPLYISDGGRLISELLKGKPGYLNHLIQGGTLIAIAILATVGFLNFT